MPNLVSRSPRERLEEALYEDSFKRLKKRGLSEESARRVAQEVAKQTAERTKVPEFDSQDDLAEAVGAVCRSLDEGKSYYDVIGDKPYLVTSRIDRLVASAGRVRPHVPADLAAAAKRATRLERLSGGLAVLFASIALIVLGMWHALGVGIFVSVGSEVYLQTSMPAKVRRLAARHHLTVWTGSLGLLALLYSAYSWLGAVEHALMKGIGLAFFVFVIAAVAPGFTLAVLVGLRERKWRSDLEKELAEQESDGV